MTSRDFIAALKFGWRAQTIYDVHAPKAFSFIGEVIEDTRTYYWFEMIERLREHYLKSDKRVDLVDHGAGSMTASAKTRLLRDVARTSGTPARFGEYLLKAAEWCGATNMIELGTNLGLGTAYLAASLPHDGHLITIDADAQLLNEAQRSLARLPHRGKVSLVEGTFVDTLPDALSLLQRVDLAYIDGHHEEVATQRYFAQVAQHCHANSLVILDDIHWSEGMERAWESIKQSPGVSLTIDLYRWGIVMFDPAVRIPQHLDIVPWQWKPWHMGFFSARSAQREKPRTAKF